MVDNENFDWGKGWIKYYSTRIANDSLCIVAILPIGLGDSPHSIKYDHPVVHKRMLLRRIVSLICYVLGTMQWYMFILKRFIWTLVCHETFARTIIRHLFLYCKDVDTLGLEIMILYLFTTGARFQQVYCYRIVKVRKAMAYFQL